MTKKLVIKDAYDILKFTNLDDILIDFRNWRWFYNTEPAPKKAIIKYITETQPNNASSYYYLQKWSPEIMEQNLRYKEIFEKLFNVNDEGTKGFYKNLKEANTFLDKLNIEKLKNFACFENRFTNDGLINFSNKNNTFVNYANEINSPTINMPRPIVKAYPTWLLPNPHQNCHNIMLTRIRTSLRIMRALVSTRIHSN